MYQYVEFQEMVYQRRNSLDKNSNSSSFPWKNNSKRKVVGSHSKVLNSKKKSKGHIVSQCPNKRTMIMKDSGEVETNEESDNDLMSFLEDDNEELLHDGDLLIVQRVLNMQEKGENEAQGENIFCTRYLVQGKVCSMIIDGGSCTNVAITILVEKLNLQTAKHHMPYKLQ
ncbi:hypothetical protein CR513_57112, partial [Mucuna pruriens]